MMKIYLSPYPPAQSIIAMSINRGGIVRLRPDATQCFVRSKVPFSPKAMKVHGLEELTIDEAKQLGRSLEWTNDKQLYSDSE